MATTTPIKLTRHYRQLSEEETSALVEAVADLIVTFLKGSRESVFPDSDAGQEVQA